MDFLDKVWDYLSIRSPKYNPLIDALLEDVMNNGELFGFRDGEVLVKVDGKIYSMEVIGYPHSDLGYVRQVTGFRPRDYTVLFRGRPSRRVHIRFWEWLENREPCLYICLGEVDTSFMYQNGNWEKVENKLLKEFGYHGA